MMVKNNNCMRKWYWWRWEWRWRLKSVIVSHVFELRQSRWLQRGKKKIERSGSSDTSYLVFIDRSCDKHVIQSRKSGLRNIHTLHILLLPPQRGFSGTYNIQRWAVCSHVLSLRDSTYQSKENEHDKSQIPRVFQWPPVLSWRKFLFVLFRYSLQNTQSFLWLTYSHEKTRWLWNKL